MRCTYCARLQRVCVCSKLVVDSEFGIDTAYRSILLMHSCPAMSNFKAADAYWLHAPGWRRNGCTTVDINCMMRSRLLGLTCMLANINGKTGQAMAQGCFCGTQICAPHKNSQL